MRLTYDHEQRNTGEERAPRHRAQRILDTIDGAWRRSEDEQLHVVQHKRHDLQEARRRTGQTLQNDVGEEERRRLGQVLREQGWDRRGVVDKLREGGNDTGRERHDKERVL